MPRDFAIRLRMSGISRLAVCIANVKGGLCVHVPRQSERGTNQVRLAAVSHRKMCVRVEAWPSSGSVSTQAGGSYGIYLLTNRVIYEYRSTDYPGECLTGSCVIVLPNERELHGYLSYAEFGLPTNAYSTPKELRFKPQPFWCS